jgi:hypothetical protein
MGGVLDHGLAGPLKRRVTGRPFVLRLVSQPAIEATIP